VPTQTFTHEALTPASAGEVWAALQLPTTWEAIPGVDRVVNPVVDEAGALRGFEFQSVAGGRPYVGKASPSGRIEEQLMSWDISTSELKGALSVEIGAAESGTSVAVTLAIQSVGMLSSMFFPIIASALGSGFPRAVEEFASGLS
jgi:hypothetical protein